MDKVIKDAIEKRLISIERISKEADPFTRELIFIAHIGRTYLYDLDVHTLPHLKEWIRFGRN